MQYKRKIIPYNQVLKEKARTLRNNSTKSGVLLWQLLKNKKMLAIEIDGESHFGKEEYDEARQKNLGILGVRFFRFKDTEVIYNLDRVLKNIETWISQIRIGIYSYA